jgi:hypothetical protein
MSVNHTGRLSLLTFFGEAKKVSAARHERDHGEQNIDVFSLNEAVFLSSPNLNTTILPMVLPSSLLLIIAR